MKNFDRVDCFAFGLAGIIILGCMFVAGMAYDKQQYCQKLGGVFISSNCVKKEAVIE